MANKSFTD